MLRMLFRMLLYAEDESKMQSEDAFTALQYLSSNRVARPHVWTWLRLKWPQLVHR